MTEAGWPRTGLAELQITFVQNGPWVPFFPKGTSFDQMFGDSAAAFKVHDGSDGQADRWDAYLASLPKRRFERKTRRLILALRGDPALDFNDRHFLNTITRSDLHAAALMVRRALQQVQAGLKPSDGVDMSALIDAAEAVADRQWDNDDALRKDLRVASDLNSARIDAMDPWSKIDLSRSHPQARMILDNPHDWSLSDDVAPHGNDLGADILGELCKLREKSPLAIGKRFEVDLDDPTEDGAMDRIQLMLALAFAHVKHTGTCPPDIARAALDCLNRDRDAAMECVIAPHHANFGAAWDRYRRILERLAGEAGHAAG